MTKFHKSIILLCTQTNKHILHTIHASLISIFNYTLSPHEELGHMAQYGDISKSKVTVNYTLIEQSII